MNIDAVRFIADNDSILVYLDLKQVQCNNQ